MSKLTIEEQLAALVVLVNKEEEERTNSMSEISDTDADTIRKGRLTGFGAVKCDNCGQFVHQEYSDKCAHAASSCGTPEGLRQFYEARREILAPYDEDEGRNLKPGREMDLRIAHELLGYGADEEIPSGISTTAYGMFFIINALEHKGLNFQIGERFASITKTQYMGVGERLIGHWSYPALDCNYPQALAYCVIAMLDKRVH